MGNRWLLVLLLLGWRMNSELGRLFDALERGELHDRTLLILTSDHGEEFWDHGGPGHGLTLYREQLHVPLVIKVPGDRPIVSKDIDALSGLVNLAPPSSTTSSCLRSPPTRAHPYAPSSSLGTRGRRASSLQTQRRLSAELDGVLVDHLETAQVFEKRAMDEELVERLKSLGTVQ